MAIDFPFTIKNPAITEKTPKIMYKVSLPVCGTPVATTTVEGNVGVVA